MVSYVVASFSWELTDKKQSFFIYLLVNVEPSLLILLLPREKSTTERDLSTLRNVLTTAPCISSGYWVMVVFTQGLISCRWVLFLISFLILLGLFSRNHTSIFPNAYSPPFFFLSAAVAKRCCWKWCKKNPCSHSHWWPWCFRWVKHWLCGDSWEGPVKFTWERYRCTNCIWWWSHVCYNGSLWGMLVNSVLSWGEECLWCFSFYGLFLYESVFFFPLYILLLNFYRNSTLTWYLHTIRGLKTSISLQMRGNVDRGKKDLVKLRFWGGMDHSYPIWSLWVVTSGM